MDPSRPEPYAGAELIAAARAIATVAHAGQTDKAGERYITHPARVAGALADAGHGPCPVAAAWLHDVLEDSPVTAQDLRRAGIPDNVVAAVQALTRRDGESHTDAVLRAGDDTIAVHVKRADIADNADPRRLARLDPATRQRLRTKYAHATSLLPPT